MSGRPHALVTGGARRVGRAAALALARSGWDVTVTFNTSDDDAKRVVGEAQALGACAAAERLPLDDPQESASQLVHWLGGVGRLDALVLNASAYAPSQLDAHDAAHAERLMRVNALTPLALCAAAAPALGASPVDGGGSIVAMLDIHAMGRPRRGYAAYAMSKSALHEMVRSLAVELAPHVRVNGVAPGVVAWPETGADADPALQERYLSRVPLQRSGTPDDAAEAVVWLVTGARYTTGHVVRVDGGRMLS